MNDYLALWIVLNATVTLVAWGLGFFFGYFIAEQKFLSKTKES